MALDFSTGFHPWTDWEGVAGWRLQRHSDNTQWRLMRPDDQVQCRGSESHCRDVFADIRAAESLSWQNDHYVVLLHGLARTGRCMRRMATAIRQRTSWTPVRFFYSTTTRDISKHAEALDHTLASLPPESTVDFVGHSLGSIVLRRWFQLRSDGKCENSCHPHRMVMLGPPNQGSKLATALYGWYAFRRYFGQTGVQLGGEWKRTTGLLAEPSIPFGIIAGRIPPWLLRNPVLGPESDLIVTVEETRLESAKEHRCVSVPHMNLMSSQRVIELTLRFLERETFQE